MKCLETVINDGNYKWLVEEEVVDAPDINDVSVDRIKAGISREFEIKKVYKLVDAGLLECKKCGATVKFKEGVTPPYCPECKRRSVFAVVTPEPLTYWADIPYKGEMEPETSSLLYDIVNLIKKCVVLESEIEYYVLALWCIASWKYEHFNTAPYLHFVGPIESGKSRALDIINRLGYRTFEMARATVASIPRITNLYHSSLTLDEAETSLSSQSETSAILKAILKAGYRKGQHYVTADKEDQNKLMVYDVFGFKALASNRMFDSALHSRSIIFWMKEAKPEIKDLDEVEEDFADLRYRLLCYRYENSPPPPYPDNEVNLYGRIRELFQPIIRVAKHFGYDVDGIVEFAKKQKIKQLEDLFVSGYADVLSYIYDEQHRIDEPIEVTVKSIAESCDLTPQRVGYILRDLNIKTIRRNYGKVVSITDTDNLKQLQYLYQKFGIGEYAVGDKDV